MMDNRFACRQRRRIPQGLEAINPRLPCPHRLKSSGEDGQLADDAECHAIGRVIAAHLIVASGATAVILSAMNDSPSTPNIVRLLQL
jgi:hypothetical protein